MVLAHFSNVGIPIHPCAVIHFQLILTEFHGCVLTSYANSKWSIWLCGNLTKSCLGMYPVALFGFPAVLFRTNWTVFIGCVQFHMIIVCARCRKLVILIALLLRVQLWHTECNMLPLPLYRVCCNHGMVAKSLLLLITTWSKCSLHAATKRKITLKFSENISLNT